MANNKFFLNNMIVNTLQRQRKSGKYCDIRLAMGKKYVWVHSAVMCPISEYINAAYLNSAKLEKPGIHRKHSYALKIKLNGKTSHNCYECLKKVINFIYAQEINIDEEHASHLYEYCKLLGLSTTVTQLMNDTIHNIEDFVKNEMIIKTEPLNDAEDDLKFPDVCVTDFKNSNKYLSPESMLGIIEADLTSNYSDQEEFGNDYDKSNLLEDNPYLKLPTGKTQNCIGCDFKCYKSIDLLGHLRQTGHGGNVCSLCWTELNNTHDLMKHFILHEHPKPFFCTFCDLRFQTRSLLGQHLPRHLLEKPYICPHCQKAFKRKHGLNCHLTTHSNEKKHLCDECGFSTTHARILRAHKLTHSGNLFKCSFSGCTHTSTRKENMKQHFATHSNDKPFVCELCGHKFTQSKSLKRHSTIHSKDDMDHICPHCPFKARRIDNLKAHIFRQHTDKPPKNELTITIEPDVTNFLNPLSSLLEHSKRRK